MILKEATKTSLPKSRVIHGLSEDAVWQRVRLVPSVHASITDGSSLESTTLTGRSPWV